MCRDVCSTPMRRRNAMFVTFEKRKDGGGDEGFGLITV